MARLVGSFLVLSVFMVAVVGFIGYQRGRDALKASVFDRLEAVAALKDDAFKQWIDEQRRNVVFVASLPEVRVAAGELLEEADPSTATQSVAARSSLAARLDFVVRHTADAQELLVLDLEGRIVVSTVPVHEGEPEGDQEYFLRGLSGTAVQNAYVSRLSGRPTITIGTPLFDESRRRVGVLAADLNLQRIDRIVLERTGLGRSGETYIVGSDHRLVGAGLTGTQRARAIRSDGIDAALAGRDGSGLYQNYTGVPVIGVYRWLEDREVALVAEMSQAEAFAPARRLALTIGIVGLAVVGLLAAGIYFIARQIARPILAITETAAAVAGGDLTRSAPVTTKDEVGVLAGAFNAMTAQLRETLAGLEQRVAARTEELRRQNQELEALHETTLGVMHRLDLDDLLRVLLERAGQLLDTAHGYIYLVRPGGMEIENRVSVGVYQEDVGMRMILGEGLADHVWQTGKPLVVGDYDAWEGRSVTFPRGSSERQSACRSCRETRSSARSAWPATWRAAAPSTSPTSSSSSALPSSPRSRSTTRGSTRPPARRRRSPTRRTSRRAPSSPR